MRTIIKKLLIISLCLCIVAVFAGCNENSREKESVKKAKAAFRLFHMKQIRDAAASGNWQASAWSLERCFPDEYGRFVKVEADNGILTELLGALKNDGDD